MNTAVFSEPLHIILIKITNILLVFRNFIFYFEAEKGVEDMV